MSTGNCLISYRRKFLRRNRKPLSETEAPEDAVENHAILVSLEGMQVSYPFPSTTTDPPKTISSAMLASWFFHCEKART